MRKTWQGTAGVVMRRKGQVRKKYSPGRIEMAFATNWLWDNLGLSNLMGRELTTGGRADWKWKMIKVFWMHYSWDTCQCTVRLTSLIICWMLSFRLAHDQALRKEFKCKLYIWEVVLENASRLMGKGGWGGKETHEMRFVKLVTTTGKEIKVRHHW